MSASLSSLQAGILLAGWHPLPAVGAGLCFGIPPGPAGERSFHPLFWLAAPPWQHQGAGKGPSIEALIFGKPKVSPDQWKNAVLLQSKFSSSSIKPSRENSLRTCSPFLGSNSFSQLRTPQTLAQAKAFHLLVQRGIFPRRWAPCSLLLPLSIPAWADGKQQLF